MDLGLVGKRALVTGSTAGIGEATAKLLASEGAIVMVHGRNRENAARVAKAIEAAGGEAAIAIGDLTDERQAGSVVESVLGQLGGVDILFNNAGGASRTGRSDSTEFLDLLPDDWLACYDQNVLAMVRMIRGLVPGMKERGWGRVVQNASAVASTPRNWENDYAAAKAAVVNLTVGLSKALANTGVTANTVSPGLILTDGQLTGSRPWLRVFAESQGWDTRLPLSELERLWAQSRNIPTGRAGRVENIAAVVAILCSPLGGFVNGANIRIDGGQNAAIN